MWFLGTPFREGMFYNNFKSVAKTIAKLALWEKPHPWSRHREPRCDLCEVLSGGHFFKYIQKPNQNNCKGSPFGKVTQPTQAPQANMWFLWGPLREGTFPNKFKRLANAIAKDGLLETSHPWSRHRRPTCDFYEVLSGRALFQRNPKA